MKAQIHCLFIVLTLLAGLAQTGRAAVALTITPNTVSNTYSGPITVQVTGLTNTETVVIQKFLDANTNGVIDGSDLLWQQYTLTDGTNFVIGGVTNNNVPGDTDGTANGQITAKLNFQSDFLQTFGGKYLVKLSSPVGHFTPITNSFTVTNFPYAQRFTGTVVSNSVAVPNAVVILFPASQDGNPSGGCVANNSGSYTLPASAGTYSLVPFKTNFIANFRTAPALTLSNNATFTTNLSLIAATQTISGKIVDANNSSLGLPGLLVPVQTQDRSLLGTCFTDTNGNFTTRVNANQWSIGGDSAAVAFHGYVEPQNKTTVDTTTGSVSGVTIALHKATAFFYGTVKDNLGNPLPQEVAVYADDNNNGLYESDGYTDTNGNYVTAVVGGLGNSDPWYVSIDNSSSFPNYIFSQPAFDQNGGTNIGVGSAVLANFTAILATNHITGYVKDSNGNPISGVGVNVNTTTPIGGVNYQSSTDTDTNGNFSLNVPNGSWDVGVNQQGGDDSLDNILGSGNYQPPNDQNVVINNNNQVANFTVQLCDGVQIITASPLPGAQQGNSYYVQLQASACNNNFTWSVNDPADFPYGLNLNFDSSGEIYGTPTGSGTYNFSVHVDDGNGHTADTNLSLTINPTVSPLQITTTYLPNGTNTIFYSQTLQATGGTPPYSWSIPNYSASLPANLSLATNGVLSGTPATTANTYYFDIIVTDAATNTAEEDALPLTIVNPPLPPLVITNLSLPNGNVGAAYGAQLGATGGQSPYTWALALGSANPPPGLLLNASGLISGTPTTNGLFNFKVQATDANFTVTNKLFGIIVNPKPVLSLANWFTNQFQMRLAGASNQNYTVQMSTNLSSASWISLFITNNPATNAFLLTDPHATNQQRFYRILIGP
jgi:hypothetical protein